MKHKKKNIKKKLKIGELRDNSKLPNTHGIENPNEERRERR